MIPLACPRRSGSPQCFLQVAARRRCSTTTTSQSSIAQWLQTNYGETATVSCPNDRPINMGDVFNCTATTDSGINVNLQVTQTDNTGNVSFNITDVS